MSMIVDGNLIAEKILTDLRERVLVLKAKGGLLTLAVLLVGDDQASRVYVNKKEKTAKEIGLEFLRFEYPADITKEKLTQEIKEIQATNSLAGMIVQLPLPDALWPQTREIVNHIDLAVDVDCLTHRALGRVLMGEHFLTPPTPGAIMEILKYHQINLQGKEVCLVGRGELIGKPLAAMLLSQPITLKVCGKSTPDLGAQTRTADIIITGVGKKNLITADMVKEGAVVIDAGICFEDNKVAGDVDFEAVSAKASLITPVVGGVGPLTVAKLLENTVIVAEKKYS